MGLFKGSATLTRYTVSTKLPANFNAFLDERVRAMAFRPIDDTTEELAVGWVAAHDFLDTGFAYNAYLIEPYVMLGFRVDRRRVPAALLKKYQRMAEQKAQELRGPEAASLSRSQREELKEKVRLELLQRIPPTTQAIDVCWDTVRGKLWLGTASGGVRDLFEDYFRRSFERELRLSIPWTLAQELVTQPRARENLDAAAPLTLYAAGE